MPIEFPIADLPIDLSQEDAIEAVYVHDLNWITEKLRRGVSCLVECDKQLVTFFYAAIRNRLRDTTQGDQTLRCRFVSGQARQEEGEEQQARGTLMQLMIRQITDLVRSAEPGTVIVVPHLDLLTTTTRSGLSMEAREVIALCYENPEVLLLGFKDPEFELPKTIESVFTAKRAIIGIPRDRLTHVVLQREGRKFGVESFDPFSLYKYVSGLNAIRLRQILGQFWDRMDFDPRTSESRDTLFRDIRELTLGAELEVPKIDLEKDIGGYQGVKDRIQKDILTLLKERDLLTTEDGIKAVEELIPRGMIFEGPPGTGKTFFAKAIATAIDATAIVVSGPELKSKWVGESESNLRNIFTRARRSAPAIIIFDEIDSFAHRRGSYASSGVEHSMVNQLLTEMDGFRKEELVFIIATTNFVESLDDALLRPGRFELKIKIPYPKEKDRRAILEIYQNKFGLDLSEDLFEHLVRKTSGYVNAERRVKFSGDHLYAVLRGLAREQIRQGRDAELTSEHADEVIGDVFELGQPTKEEEKLIASHECGHTLTATLIPESPRPDKVTIEGDDEDISPFYTRFDSSHRGIVYSRQEAIANIAVSLGGRAAEQVVIGDISTGAADDLSKATGVARAMIEAWGMGSSQEFCYEETRDGWRRRRLSDAKEKRLDEEVDSLINEAYQRALKLCEDHKDTLTALAELLIEKRVLNQKDLKDFFTGRDYEIDWRDPIEIKDAKSKKTDASETPAEREETVSG